MNVNVNLNLNDSITSTTSNGTKEQFERHLRLGDETNSPQDDLEIVKLLTRIGNTFESMGDFDMEIHTFNRCLTKLISIGVDYANTLRNIGSVYERKENYDLAMQNLNEFLRIRSIGPDNYFKLVFDLDSQLPKYDEGFDACKRNLIPLNHPDVAITLNKMGNVYFKRKDYNSAMLKFDEAMKIFQKTLPHEHSLVATTISWKA